MRIRFGFSLAMTLVLATSCTGAVRSASTAPVRPLHSPAPFDTGFVTPGDDVVRTVRIGDVAVVHPCMIGGVPFMRGPLPVYPHARQTFAGDDVPNGYVRLFESDDEWQTIAHWYRLAMPEGSERKVKPGCDDQLFKGTPPLEVALFSVGTLGKDYRAVFITGLPANERPHGWPKDKKVPRTIITLKDR